MTVLSGSTRRKGIANVGVAAVPAAAARPGNNPPKVSPAPASEVNFKKSRRVSSDGDIPGHSDSGSL